MKRLRLEAFWGTRTHAKQGSRSRAGLRKSLGDSLRPGRIRFGILLAMICSSAAPLAAQNFRPSTQVEALVGSSEFDFDTEGTTTAVVFIEASTQDVYVAVSNNGALSWSPPVRVDQDLAGSPKRLLKRAVQIENGQVHVAWIEAPGASADSIHVMRSSDGGFTFVSSGVLPGSGATQGEIPDGTLAVQDDPLDNDVHVLWRLDLGLGSHELYLASSDPALVDTFLAPVIVRASSLGDVEGADLDVDSDRIFVAWVDDRNGDDDLWLRSSVDRGSSWIQSTDTRLDSGGIAGAKVYPDVRLMRASVLQPPVTGGFSGFAVSIGPVGTGGTVNLGGSLWALWREDATALGMPELRSRVSFDGGVTLDPVTVVGSYLPGFDAVASFDAVLSLTQGFLVAWEDNRTSSAQIFAARSGSNGSSWLFEAMLSSTTATEPNLVLDEDGTAAVAWIETGAPDRVGSAFSLDAGLTWSPPIDVSAGALGNASQVAVSYNPGCENVMHFWLDDENGGPNVLAGGYLVGTCSCFFASDGSIPGCNERTYTPMIAGAGHLRQRLTIFYPDENVFTKPTAGWPVLLYSPAGAFAEAAAIGTDASALPGLCGEPPTTNTTVSGLGLKFLSDALQSGWSVITVGTIGWNSLSVNGRDPNLFFDQGSAEWNAGNAFWGEQEFTWARQYVAQYANTSDLAGCPPLEIDNDRVVVCGTSTGAIYSAFVALGPDRADPGNLDAQLQQSTHCAGAVLFESPTWFPAYDTNLAGLHWPLATDPTVRADFLFQVNPADLIASSISTYLRSPGSMAIDTPVFLSFDEALQDLDFSRSADCSIDPAGSDPVLSDTLFLFVHDLWFGLIAYEDLDCIDSAFHSSQSRLWIDASLDTSNLTSPQAEMFSGTFSGGVQGDELQDKALAWLLSERATSVDRNTVGTDTSFNPECYETISAPVICGTWRAKVDVSQHPMANLTSLLIFADVFGIPAMYQGFAIYVDLTCPPIGVDLKVPGSTSSIHEVPIPGDPTLAGLTFFTQAAILGGGLEICNGIDLVFGY